MIPTDDFVTKFVVSEVKSRKICFRPCFYRALKNQLIFNLLILQFQIIIFIIFVKPSRKFLPFYWFSFKLVVGRFSNAYSILQSFTAVFLSIFSHVLCALDLFVFRHYYSLRLLHSHFLTLGRLPTYFSFSPLLAKILRQEYLEA